MCDEIKQEILNEGLYEPHSFEEIMIQESIDLNVIIKEEYEYQCPESFKTECFSNESDEQCNEICGKSQQAVRSFKCDQCPKTFKTKYFWVNHMVREHGIGAKFYCDICEKLFIRHSVLKAHMTKHSDEKTAHCEICDKSFKTKYILNTHMKMMHATGKSFQCQICPKSFAFASNLKQHLDTHNEKRPYKCDLCRKTFKAQRNLINHNAQVHSSGGKFSCDVCGKLFINLCQLKAHMPKHSDQKNIHCDKCDMRFKRNSHLASHMKQVHATENPFKCTTCPRSFLSDRELKRHMFSHNEKRPFKCDECFRAYKEQRFLTNHKAEVHSSCGKFSCDVCGKPFIHLSHLKRHMTKHNDEQNVDCDICHKRYKSKRTLVSHKKTAHATEKSFQFVMVDDVKVEPIVLFDPEMKRNVLDKNLDVKDVIEDKITLDVDIKKEQEDIDY